MDVSKLLGPSARSRFEKYQLDFHTTALQAGVKRAFIADLSQDPDYRNRSSHIISALMHNAMHYSFTQRHLFTAAEMCVAHG